MQTFLDLCNDLILELGINGGNQLNSTRSSLNSSESARIVDYIAKADYEIQSMHHNWRFMWRQFRGTLNAGSDILAVPQFGPAPIGSNASGGQSGYQMKKIDRESLVFGFGTNQVSRPRFQDWRTFEATWQSGVKNTAPFPAFWSLTPAGNPIISQLASASIAYQYECWARPQRMQNDGDLSPLNLAYGFRSLPMDVVEPYSLNNPSSVGQLGAGNVTRSSGSPTGAARESLRIIIVRAKVMYAEAEGATEVMQGALAEYQDLLEALRADQLPGVEHDRVSENDVPLVVETI
jgi:hypothetical protein